MRLILLVISMFAVILPNLHASASEHTPRQKLSAPVDSTKHDNIVFYRNANLWIMHADGTNQERLSNQPIDGFSVSKQGEVIAYESNGNCYVLFNKQRKTIKISDGYRYTFPVISPDGSKLALVKKAKRLTAEDARRLGVSAATVNTPQWYKEGILKYKTTELYVYDLSSRKFSLIVKDIPGDMRLKEFYATDIWWDGEIYWSSDSSRLHFSRNFMPYEEKGGCRSAYIVNVNTKKLKYIQEQEHVVGWHGDILEYRHEEGSYSYNILTGKKLDHGQGSMLIYSYSPDRTKAAYLNYNNTTKRNSLVVRTLATGKERTMLVLKENEQVYDVLWGNDGQMIFTWHTLNPSAPVGIWRIKADGTNLMKLADDVSRPVILYSVGS